MSVSSAFSCFMQEAPAHAAAWLQVAKSLDAASALDKKTEELAYIAVLAATGNTSGMPVGQIAWRIKAGGAECRATGLACRWRGGHSRCSCCRRGL